MYFDDVTLLVYFMAGVTIPEEEFSIPADGNVSAFTTDAMAGLLRCLGVEERLVSHLHRQGLDGRRFSRLKVIIMIIFVCLFVCLFGTWAEHSEDHPLLGATWALQFRLRQASVCRSHMHAGYLPVSGPPDFRFVIQVVLSPRMIF